MQILVTGTSGYIGAALTEPLLAQGHDVRGFARDPARVEVEVPVVQGDAVAGTGLDDALAGVDVAYFLIHSMEQASAAEGFDALDRRAAQNFAAAAARNGVRRVVYLGGLLPQDKPLSLHLRSRLEVEEILLACVPEAVALRASIVIGARSRSFRFLVHLVERAPLLPLPNWRDKSTRPIDGRDVLAFLTAAGTSPEIRGATSLDIAGPDTLTYGELIDRIRDLMLVDRPKIEVNLTLNAVASRVAAAIAGEDHALIGPLMESLESDLLPRDDRAAELLGVRLHRFDAAVERALRDWEVVEELAAR
jgi:uncharacterized protein YbjT (DUF2867 family)